MQSKTTRKIAATLRQAARAHHKLAASRFDEDANWAKWYAKYLLEQTEFQNLTQREWTEDDLSFALEALDESFRQNHPKHSWSDYYAERLVD